MSKKTIHGICHLCGTEGPLSFEHVPPRAAFNDQPVLRYTFDQMMAARPDEHPEGGTIQQRGSGAYTLCVRCNNKTGRWYGSKFVAWCHQGMELLARTGGKPTLIYMHYVFPLAVLKQIYALFFSINGERFHESHPDLVRFVLDKERKYLPPRYRVYCYYTAIHKPRFAGVSGLLNLNSSSSDSVRIMSELAYPPFGYLLTFEQAAQDSRLFEISHFARYDYNEFSVMNLQLPVLPTYTLFPGDYRTLEEIRRDAATNAAAERPNSAS